MKEKPALWFEEIEPREAFTHIMLTPVTPFGAPTEYQTKTGAFAVDHEAPERVAGKLSKNHLDPLMAQMPNESKEKISIGG